MLVIGNGNSACEICIDAVEHDVNKITLVSRRPRHFIPLETFDKDLRQLMIGKYLGAWDRDIHPKLMKMTKAHSKFQGIFVLDHTFTTHCYLIFLCFSDFVKRSREDSDKISVDLSEYGIIKPKLSNVEETVEGNYDVIDIGFIPLMKKGRVSVINKGGVASFDGDDVIMENGEILQDKYDVIVICTGFEHGLEKLFDDRLFKEYFYDGIDDKCKLYQRYKIFPKTNGFNQALNDQSLYFACFDPPITGGLARGLWGWKLPEIYQKMKVNIKKRWNYHIGII